MFTMSSGPLSGYSFTSVGGPTGHPISVVSLEGRIQRKIYLAMKEYGAVSSCVEEMNPYSRGGYQSFCETTSSLKRDEL